MHDNPRWVGSKPGRHRGKISSSGKALGQSKSAKLRDIKEAASSWESEGSDPVGLQAPPNEGVSYSEMRSHWKILKRDETRCDHRVVPVKG